MACSPIAYIVRLAFLSRKSVKMIIPGSDFVVIAYLSGKKTNFKIPVQSIPVQSSD